MPVTWDGFSTFRRPLRPSLPSVGVDLALLLLDARLWLRLQSRLRLLWLLSMRRLCRRLRPLCLMLWIAFSPFGCPQASQAARALLPLATMATAWFTASFVHVLPMTLW